VTAYYNEIDVYAAQWLRNLIQQGLIADGDVDTRSISDVTPNDVRGYTQCHFFAGLGGWSGALRLSGIWPDRRPVWTGSCPCQPFSLAGKQGGFADERHLWPHFRYLIAQCRPTVVLGEQVASASEWFRLVRGDLEALEYAVGCMPVEAASAGADHLRDRFWFVADDGRRRRAGSREGQGQFERRAEIERTSNGVDQVDARSTGLAIRPLANQQRGPVRQEGPTVAATGDRGGAMADADGERQPGWPQQHGGAQQPGQQAPCGNDAVRCGLADTERSGLLPGAQPGIHREQEGARPWHVNAERCSSDASYEWVIGADGKQRRVKPGIRLLAHGVPARVAKLRALGNAIDLRPAAAWIKAVHESLT
jgi:DNA (cytosine-5)-methyltransferase 1